ncbi:4'-phosphopantetheinyl transferase family protein [Streptomyces rhizosphaerihabitans]|uniref:4'-phosphopantetheinyl transferase family protein n=1 Tax=Streptomyces rhizosphaerihabitans TaxID=1266770 RepID=UPI0021C14BCE|nr:4'-phosphopantetheinyl transferase superfamily protein [Streptomyces rhizosphaerihabitans]MCT9011173.1 4'-phosphopantetheinyl transferase superfamily protein [Streptomyces rhizosphaerihabitans]
MTPASRQELCLEEGDLAVWLLTPPAEAPLALDELDATERRRADAFRRRGDRTLYVAAHIALRRLLAGYLRTSAKELAFARADCPRCGGPHGRPVLSGAGPDAPHFSLSHSRGAVLVGVARAPVGVDVERLPRPERVDVCRSALHPWEQRELAALRAPDQPARFARLWARKEAYLKGTGVGVGGWTSEVYLGEGGPGAPPRPDDWSVVDVPSGPGHAAAVAMKGAASRTTVYRLPPEAVLVGGRAPDTGRRLLAGVRQVLDADHALDDLEGRDALEEELT